jgi:hypothetical protein
MGEDARTNAENPPETKDEKNEELNPEQLDEIAGGNGCLPYGGGR